MTTGTHKTLLPQTTHATHVTKPPRSNRQNLARLEIAVTPTKQSPNAISNRQFLRPSRPLPWIQLIHEAFQLQHTGHFYPSNSAPTTEEFPLPAPAPQGRHRLGRSVRAGRPNKKRSSSAGGATHRAITCRAAFTTLHSFLITQSAIRNRRNPLKTKVRHAF